MVDSTKAERELFQAVVAAALPRLMGMYTLAEPLLLAKACRYGVAAVYEVRRMTETPLLDEIYEEFHQFRQEEEEMGK